MKTLPTQSRSSRAFRIIDIPVIGANELTVIVSYEGDATCAKGQALEHHVVPLLRKAPELDSCLRELFEAFNLEVGSSADSYQRDLIARCAAALSTFHRS